MNVVVFFEIFCCVYFMLLNFHSTPLKLSKNNSCIMFKNKLDENYHMNLKMSNSYAIG